MSSMWQNDASKSNDWNRSVCVQSWLTTVFAVMSSLLPLITNCCQHSPTRHCLCYLLVTCWSYIFIGSWVFFSLLTDDKLFVLFFGVSFFLKLPSFVLSHTNRGYWSLNCINCLQINEVSLINLLYSINTRLSFSFQRGMTQYWYHS